MKNSSSGQKNQESKDLSHPKNNSSNEESGESQDPSHSTNSSNEESSEESHTTNSSNEQVNISEESQDLSYITSASDQENEESQNPSHAKNSSNEDIESEESQDLSHITNASDEESEESQDPSHTKNSSTEESSEESQGLSHTSNSSKEESGEESQDLSLTMNPPKRARTSSPSPPLVQGKNNTIPVPFPWATNRRAIVRDVYFLYENNLTTITGRMRCKNCRVEFDKDLDLDIKGDEVLEFMETERVYTKGTAPAAWINPVLETCQWCGSEQSIEPCLQRVKKRKINWLFLYLSQLLGCCNSHQLKYFLKHNNITIPPDEDKGRLLYFVYTRLCDQLVPY